MMKLKRFLCLLLALLMTLGALTACELSFDGSEVEEDEDDEKEEKRTKRPKETSEDPSGTVGENETGEFGTTAPGENKNSADEALDRLSGINYGGGEFTVLYMNDYPGYAEELNANPSEVSKLSDAVYERNVTLEERCKLQLALLPVPSFGITETVKLEVTSATGDFQLITAPLSYTTFMALDGWLQDFSALDIDYQKNWWDQGTLDFSLGGHTYFMNGSYGIADKELTYVMMYNRDLQRDCGVPDLYAMVQDGEWTLDALRTFSNNMSRDNGDGRWDEYDTYGFATDYNCLNSFYFGAGCKFIDSSRNVTVPELQFALETGLELADVLVNMVHGSSTYLAEQGEEANSLQMFMDGRALFYCENLSYLRTLGQYTNGDYGILPIPKYSKDQEQYTTWTHHMGSTLSIPLSATDKVGSQQLAGVLETYTVLSYKLVAPVYIRELTTHNGEFNKNDASMLSMIFKNRVYDLAIYHSELLLFDMLPSCIASGNVTLASKYKSNQRFAQKRLDKLFENFN